MIMAVTIGRSPVSSTAERITLSAIPVWISIWPGAEHDDDYGMQAYAVPPPSTTLVRI